MTSKDEIYKEVYFDLYCKTCKYEKLAEESVPCFECLDNPINSNSHKPVNWTAKGDNHK